jgi:exosortase K
VTVRSRRSQLVDAALALAAVAAAGALKAWSRGATAADLDWLLRPTAWLVSRTGAAAFVREAGVGYVDARRGFELVPACAGLNFLTVAFLSAALLHLPALARPRDKGALLLACAPLAFLLTLVANAGRVLVALALHEHHLALGWLTPARLHEATGAATYLAVLLAASLASSALLAGRAAHAGASMRAPEPAR